MSSPSRPEPRLRVARSACAHCGLEVAEATMRPGADEQFCCAGCKKAHELLHAWGFEGYYRLRERERGRAEPANPSGRRFEDFDAPEFFAEHVEQSPRGTRRVRLFLEGIHCAACVWLVEELPRAVSGLLSVRLNLATAVAEVEWDPQQVSLSQIARALDGVGYPPHARRRADVDAAQTRAHHGLLIKIGVATVCAMNIMFIHGALYAGEHHGMDPRYHGFFRWLSLALAVPVVLFAAQPFFRAAVQGLKNRVPHIDLPIALALVAAFVFSAVATVRGSGPVYFDSLAALVALLLGGRYLQQRAQRAALSRAEGLRSVAFVEYARRLTPDGTSREVPVSTLAPGDRVEARSGELVPVDGLVIAGTSVVNNAVLTGEPTPLFVAPGDPVWAGATNSGSRLVIETQATGAATKVGGLLALVDEALAKRAPLVQLADRLSRHFVVAVLGLGLAAGLVAYFRTQGDTGAAFEQLIAMWVVTCPCALGLATPVALTVGLTRAAKAGIFIKNPDVFERLPRVDTVFLDKTGTLTEGMATISHWGGDTKTMDLAFALEAESAHPVAQAFRRAAAHKPHPSRIVREVTEIPGRGIKGVVDQHGVAVGNRLFVESLGVAIPAALLAEADELGRAGSSPLFVAVDGVARAVAGLSDPLRADAKRTVQAFLRSAARVRILSGDHPTVVEGIARELGLDSADAVGGLTPEDKLDLVSAAEPDSEGILMVGDGVNDAAAMARADIGVAVKGGSGASIVAADVVLARPGLAPLVDLCQGSERLRWVVRRNLAFSLVYNLAGAALTMAGLVGPLLAAILMPVSSLTVILSSVAGRRFAPRGDKGGRLWR